MLDTPSRAITDILTMRETRRTIEGDAFDDALINAELPNAVHGVLTPRPDVHPRSRLVLAASFLVAEIERMDRAVVVPS